MSITAKSIILALYVVSPYFLKFILGFGGFDKPLGLFFPIYLLGLVVLLLYDGFLAISLLQSVIHKKKSPLLYRFVIITGALSVLALQPMLSSVLRCSGACFRLRIAGGDKFCEQLLADASRLVGQTGAERKFVSFDELPYNFRRIGGISAQIGVCAKEALVDIRTSDRHDATGWILIPEPSTASVSSNYPVRVKERIYRY